MFSPTKLHPSESPGFVAQNQQSVVFRLYATNCLLQRPFHFVTSVSSEDEMEVALTPQTLPAAYDHLLLLPATVATESSDFFLADFFPLSETELPWRKSAVVGGSCQPLDIGGVGPFVSSAETTLQNTGNNSTTLTIAWNEPLFDGGCGGPRGYRLYMKRSGGAGYEEVYPGATVPDCGLALQQFAVLSELGTGSYEFYLKVVSWWGAQTTAVLTGISVA